MPPQFQTPLIRLGNLFPRHDVSAKCEFLAPSGCFKIRGATHLLDHLRQNPAPVRLFGCEPYNYPKYARFDHARSATIADGLMLETPHPSVQQAIADAGVAISLVAEDDIRAALRDLFETQGLVVEPSSAITLAFVQAHAGQLEGPVCVILTGEN